MAKSQPDSNDRRLLTLLEGQSCPYCADGELERGVYKDNRAMVCDSCETPHVQLWQPAEY
ncbi:HVO_A0556 family zinc finger protein [Natronorubrum halophilum]|uniref:HVO_A0556 family zinc finger protein n=1 Tax=Natronorubrum halophilum TaxID=1702106 RepID=UPI000EF6F03D|nr:HVO_A0556 family zinc finger protein [Natronorubrum halophilum]